MEECNCIPRVLIVEMAALRAAGATFQAIAAALNKRGVTAPRGGRWYGATIHHILRGHGAAGLACRSAQCRCRALPARHVQAASPDRSWHALWKAWTDVQGEAPSPPISLF
jgi:hypothetical protein